MQSQRSHEQTFQKDYGVLLDDVHKTYIMEDTMSSMFLAGSSKTIYIPYITICNMMIQPERVLHLLVELREDGLNSITLGTTGLYVPILYISSR